MEANEVRDALTALGAWGDVDFCLNGKRVSTSPRVGIAIYDSGNAKKMHAYMAEVLVSYQQHLSSMNRAMDTVKLSNWYATIEKSSMLSIQQKQDIRDRIEKIDFMRPLLQGRFLNKKEHEDYRLEYAQYVTLKALFEGDPQYPLIANALIADNSPNRQKHSQLEIIRHIIGGLSDDARAIDYFKYLRKLAKRGHNAYVPLAKYYHCTGKNSGGTGRGKDDFEDILREGVIKAISPQTGSGRFGAWISSQPETSAYGDYIFALSFLVESYYETIPRPQQVDLLKNKDAIPNSATSISDLKPGGNSDAVVKVVNAGLQSHVKIKFEKNTTPSCLAFVAVPNEKEVDEFRKSLGKNPAYAPILQFPRANDEIDCAVFLTKTVSKIARLYQEIEPVVMPREWNWKWK
jgi:hypothetical protein